MGSTGDPLCTQFSMNIAGDVYGMLWACHMQPPPLGGSASGGAIDRTKPDLQGALAVGEGGGGGAGGAGGAGEVVVVVEDQAHLYYHQHHSPQHRRHHSGLPARRSTNARRSLSRALSSRPQLQRSIRQKDPYSQEKLPTDVVPTPGESTTATTTNNALPPPPPRSASTSSATGRSSFNKVSRQIDQQQTTFGAVSCSTVVITCPGDESQQRRDCLWDYQSRHRGTQQTTFPAYSLQKGRRPRSEGIPPRTSTATPIITNKVQTAPSSKVTAWNGWQQGTNGKVPSSSSSLSSSGSGSSRLSDSERLFTTTSANAEKMPYRLRPIGDGAAGGGNKRGEGSRSSNDCVSEGGGSDGLGSPHPPPLDVPTLEEGRLTHLPRITPQYSPVIGNHDYPDPHPHPLLLQGGLQSSTTTRLSPIGGSGITFITSSDRFQGVMTSEDAGIDVTNGVPSTTFSPTWDATRWEPFPEDPSNPLHDDGDDDDDADDGDDAFTDCSEDRRSPEFTEPEPPKKGITRASQGHQKDIAQTTKFPSLASVARLRPYNADNSSNPQEVLIVQSMSNDIFQLNQSKQGTLEEEDNVNNLRADGEKYDQEFRQSTPPPIPSPPASRTETQLPEISTNGLVNQTTSPVNDLPSENGGAIDQIKPEQTRTREYTLDESDLLAATVISELPIEPCRRAKSYKRRSYNLQNLTANFRNEMSKHCRTNIDEEEKQWFDDIVRSSRVVDDTGYDSFARRPLPKIKQVKTLISRVHEKPVEPLPVPPKEPPPPPVKESAPKPMPLFSSSKKTSASKSKPKHSKLKLALSQWK